MRWGRASRTAVAGHDTPAMRGGGRAAPLRGASDPAAALRRAVTAARAGTTTMFNIYPNCNQTTTVQPMRKRIVTVNDKVQRGYRYVLSAPIGRDLDPEFPPELTPQQLLRLGVFGGKYMTDTKKEFPKGGFARANLSPAGRDSALNFRERGRPPVRTMQPFHPVGVP